MKILIADDHTLFRDILNTYLDRMKRDYNVILAEDFYKAYELIDNAPDNVFDLVILDLCMPGMDGFEGLKKFREKWPDTPVAIISGVAQIWEVTQAIELGASGFFPKSMSGKALVHAIELVLAGEKFVPVQYSAPPVHNPIPPMSFQGETPDSNPSINKLKVKLSPREQDVVKYLAVGASNQDIADALNLQVVTIKLHVRSICRKLNAKNRTQAALIAQHANLT